MKNKLSLLNVGSYHLGGYPSKMVDYTIKNQLLDEKTWELFVNQFRIHSDTDKDWRGEFWGKMMRGGSLTYHLTKNQKLYQVLTNSVKDILSVQETNGRISSYPKDIELQSWDMWARKYVMLGLIYYYDICKSIRLKKNILISLTKQADYIIAHVGEGEGKKSIFATSANYGGLNSCSILEAFVKLYNLTNEERYYNFATYIVESGFCEDMNLVELCQTRQKPPYQFTHPKAYEMMSCFEGLLEYSKLKDNEKYLQPVINFVDMLLETDYTIVGSSGCTSEFLDNSTETQTKYTDDILQETCVTVTLMKLCAKLLLLTGNAKYADVIERSGYNALFGAVNNENQTMEKTEGRVWTLDGMYTVPHEPFPFDSYSPLIAQKRGRVIGGFKELQEGRSYGCCACIGSAGTAIFGLTSVLQNDDTIYFNLYNDCKVSTIINNTKVSLKMVADVYGRKGTTLFIKGAKQAFTLMFRVPEWAKKSFRVYVNGWKAENVEKDGYIRLDKRWEDEKIQIKFDLSVRAVVKNEKVAFVRGPIILARDERLGDVEKPLQLTVKNGRKVPYSFEKNPLFNANETVSIETGDGAILLCDYSQAGKNYDEENCKITIWSDMVKQKDKEK